MDNEVDFMLKMLDTQGIAVSTVSDGHIFMVKMSFLKELIEKHSSKESITIFLKRPDFKN
jgi:hypothetical protein